MPILISNGIKKPRGQHCRRGGESSNSLLAQDIHIGNDQIFAAGGESNHLIPTLGYHFETHQMSLLHPAQLSQYPALAEPELASDLGSKTSLLLLPPRNLIMIVVQMSEDLPSGLAEFATIGLMPAGRKGTSPLVLGDPLPADLYSKALRGTSPLSFLAGNERILEALGADSTFGTGGVYPRRTLGVVESTPGELAPAAFTALSPVS